MLTERMVDDVLRGFVSFMDAGPPLPVALVMILGLAPILTLVHELGHALMAWSLLRGRVHVMVGRPRPLVTFGLGRISFALDPLVVPWRFDGLCSYEEPDSRSDAVLIALAGPAASLVTGIVAWSAYDTMGPGLFQDLFGVAALTSLLSVVVCLAPLTLTDANGMRMRTDGAHVLAALR